MANPHDISALDELRFGTGCRVVEHGALRGVLLGVIEELYDLEQRQSAAFYTGPDLETARVEGSQGHLEIVRGDEIMVRGAARPAPPSPPSVDLGTGWSAAEVKQQAAPAPAVGDRASVMVVDDEHDIRQILSEYLGKSGYDVRAAADGTEAMQMLQVELPDALVLDAMLPGVHGFDICRRVKQSAASQQVKVVMISAVYRGWRYADDIKRMYGADDFLEKPFRLDELKRALDQTLQAGRPTASPEEMSAQANDLLHRSAAAYRAGEKNQAADLLQQAVALAPFSVDLNRRLGLLHEQLGDPYRAIAAFERVAELETSYDNLLQLAQLYERTGFRFKAFEAWERCLWLSPRADVTEKIRAHMGELMATS
jgi:DNA-binding response OmpR family regulator